MATKKENPLLFCDRCDRNSTDLKLKSVPDNGHFKNYDEAKVCFTCVGDLLKEEGIKFTSTEIEVEQGSLAWHKLRQGRVTGTSLGSAVSPKPAVQKTLLRNLVAERMTDAKFTTFVSEAMQRGIDLEDKAVAAASVYMGRTFRKAGFLLSDNYPMFGFSPDGVFPDKNGVIVGGCESKCPNSETHLEYILDNIVPKKYDWQVRAPFVLDDNIKWWLFTSFDDRVYSKPNFFKIVRRCDILDEISEARDRLGTFLEDVRETHINLSF